LREEIKKKQAKEDKATSTTDKSRPPKKEKIQVSLQNVNVQDNIQILQIQPLHQDLLLLKINWRE
jgi:hypothetical protein